MVEERIVIGVVGVRFIVWWWWIVVAETCARFFVVVVGKLFYLSLYFLRQ